VTAYDQYAIDAFEVNAVDYLLKPVEPDGWQRRSSASGSGCGRSAEKVKKEPDLEPLLQMLADRQARRSSWPSRSTDRFLLVQTDEVVHASVEDDQIRVVTNSLSGTSNYRTLDELQTRLDPSIFWRVHRSHLVNINKIKEIVPGSAVTTY
jgi:two-component system LytT family response regulator/two-component system response regulator LytT